MSRRGDAPVTVWCGNYRFGRDDFFLPWAATVARKYVDKKPEQRPPEARFREELERLRGIAPADGRVLLDQLTHRWRHPDCPPSLYVVTCTLRAPDGWTLVDDAAKPVQELFCTKVGQARHSVAARIERYKTERLGGVSIAEGSPALRVVIYGDGSTMLLERQIQEVARNNGSRAEVTERAGVRRRVGSETYVGVGMIDAICAFARERAST